MLGLSGIEIAFCTAVALVVIGPKDLPKVVRSVSQVAAKLRKVYASVSGALTQLEREVALTERPASSARGWEQFLPPEVQRLQAATLGDAEASAAASIRRDAAAGAPIRHDAAGGAPDRRDDVAAAPRDDAELALAPAETAK